MSLKALEFFSKYIEQETGIVFHDSNLYQLQSRLEEIAKLESKANLDELLLTFQKGPDARTKQRLLDHATNNETLFFRDPAFFDAIVEFVTKSILPLNPPEIKIWSAASSTGQEALSTAITLDELSQRVKMPNFKILGTDICQRALDKANSGLYTDFEMMRGLTEERKKKYFTQGPRGWQANAKLMSHVSFRYNNLLSSSVSDSFHLILCRNVLIYMKVETKRQCVESLLSRLDPNGGLILGVGETLMGVTDKVKTTLQNKVIIYRKIGYQDKLAA